MTTIAAITDGRTVYMAADRNVSSGWQQQLLDEPKVVQTGRMLIGITGFHKVTTVIRYRYISPPHVEGKSVMAYLSVDVVDSLYKLFSDNGLIKTEDGVPTLAESYLLIGYRGHIVHIGENLSAVSISDNYDAIGSGMHYALGALRASSKSKKSMASRVEEAIKIAEHFDMGTRSPIDVFEA